MSYTTVIERKIYIGSNWKHRREKFGKLEIKSFPSNITPFDTSKIKEIVIEECSFPNDDLFELYKELDDNILYKNEWWVGELNKEHVEQLIDLMEKDDETFSEEEVKQMKDFLLGMSDEWFYEIKLI
jgi:hypothetical protein